MTQKERAMKSTLSGFAIAGAVLMGSVAAHAQDIKMGVIAGMSGPGTSYGIGIRQGAEMAVKEINAAGGVKGRKIALDVVDDASNPAQSVTAMQRLVSDKVDVIVGGWGSSQVLANMEVAERAGIPYVVVGATNPKITTDKNKWTFRVIQADSDQAEQLAEAAVKRLGMKRIAVIHDVNDYGVGNRDVFLASLKKLGLEPVTVVSYQSNDKDFTAQLERIASSNPDGIAIFGTIPAAPAIMNQARDLGIKARFIGTGGLANENLMTLAPKASEGTVLTTLFNEDVDADAKGWSQRFVKEFSGAGQPPRPILAAYEYRAIKSIVAPCLASVGTDKEKLRQCIASFKGHIFGIPGEVSFNKTGQLQQQSVFVEVRNGTFQAFKGN
jgi:branched-chain amino acid transport system substrate-binding protein